MHHRIETIQTHVGPRKALVLTPPRHLVVGEARLAELRVDHAPSAVDRAVIRAAKAVDGVRLLVFRGLSDDATGSYRIEPSLSDEDAAELVRGLVRTQLPTYRQLVRAGLTLIVATGFALRDCMLFREATARLREELSRPGSTDSVRQLDAWILEHLTVFYTMGYARLKAETLPAVLPLVERRRGALDERLAAVPPEVFEPTA